jgi:hypothetical protein
MRQEYQENIRVLAWLKTRPSLQKLCEAYPGEWKIVQKEFSAIFKRGTPDELQAFLNHLASRKAFLSKAPHKIASNKLLSQHIQYYMATTALKQYSIAAATGIKKGKIRFNLLNGYIVQKLLFAKGLERKPVKLFWFRLFWPLVWQKKYLMPLVELKGIYCFYSQKFVDELALIITGRRCLEIAAGDGTLSQFLKNKGIQIIATDDFSWKHTIQYPEEVMNLNAQSALRTYLPEVVICSWPPANNEFERHVFNNSHVQLYIVIGSKLQSASGNWQDYKNQKTFDFEMNENLSNLMIPPELQCAVYLFKRKHQL